MKRNREEAGEATTEASPSNRRGVFIYVEELSEGGGEL
jgi:hypothetical protein